MPTSPVPPTPKPSPSPSPRLPSGRHGLSREAVVASQRARLIDAMAQTVAEKGYAATTVADVVERAGVSRRTFYEQFSDKEACFLACYDAGLAAVLNRIGGAVEGNASGSWRDRARSGVEAFLALLASEPAFARALQIEILTAGPAALDRRAGMLAMFGGIWRNVHDRARAEDPGLAELPDDVFTILAAGLEELIRECLRTRGPTALPDLADPILRTVFAIFGAAAAR